MIAIEPHPANFQQLSRHLERNNLTPRVSLFRAAVTARRAREAVLFLGSDHTGHSCVFPSEEHIVVPNIPVTSLKTFAGGSGAILKVDIQGGEQDLFLPQFRDVLRAFTVVIVESHAQGREDTTGQLEQFLQKEGMPFERDKYVFWIYPQGGIRALGPSAKRNERVAANN
jgi:FkbM family methyltransferase